MDREVSVVLEFQVPYDVAAERLLVRARPDDTPEVIRRRFEIQRVPDELVEYYRLKGILVGIHADAAVEAVFAEIQEALAQVEVASR